jgi:tRNA-specific 2-thiouridylase
MSGGVDSSVAALLLKRAGFEVIGVTMKVTPAGGAGQVYDGSNPALAGQSEKTEKQGLDRRNLLPYQNLNEPAAAKTAGSKAKVTGSKAKVKSRAEAEAGVGAGAKAGQTGVSSGDSDLGPGQRDGTSLVSAATRLGFQQISHEGRRLACFGDDEEEEIREAEAVARHIGIPFYVVDLSREYEERILSYFRNEYARGRTPNPCVRCNAEIKFGLLLEACRKLGVDYDYFATGHYARVRYEEAAGRWWLLKGRDLSKDQSYFLSLLSQEQLSRALFPLGELSKSEVRQIAREAGLPVSEKEESQDFYAGNYRELLGPGKPGYIKDLSGRVLGEHEGIENFTIGQRRGLGVSSTGRLYVVKIEPETGTVYVGEEKDLLTQRFRVEGVNWIARVPQAGEEVEATVKVRYKSPELNCRIVTGGAREEETVETGARKAEAREAKADVAGGGNKSKTDSDRKGQRVKLTGKANAAGRVAEAKKILEGTPEGAESARVEATALAEAVSEVEVVLLSPYKAITPGQVAVFYDGEVVLGAGFIS